MSQINPKKAQLYQEDRTFKAIFQNASLGILLINHNGIIGLVNDFLIKLFGYSNAAEIVGKKMEILIPPRFRERHITSRDLYTRYPVTKPMGTGREFIGLRKDGAEMHLEISISSFTDLEEVHSIAFISDISKRVATEKELKKQRRRLATVNRKMERLNEKLEEIVMTRTASLQDALRKLEVSKNELSKALNEEKELGELKSSFVSMASHEFKTPLSTILSSASLLGKYTLTEEQRKRDRHIQRIKSAVLNLNGILNEFLSLRKIEDGRISTHPSYFDIEAVIKQQIIEMTEMLKPGQTVSYQHAGRKEVFLDESLFRNIIINLFSNAIKFSDKNTPIRIDTIVSDEEVCFVIKDRGMGMSQKDQKHLFEIFFRSSNAVNIPGTGLGLHIVYRYVEMMNGKIMFESELDKGTEVKIIFKP